MSSDKKDEIAAADAKVKFEAVASLRVKKAKDELERMEAKGSIRTHDLRKLKELRGIIEGN